ncbi:hypothetical protein D3C86_1789000 [compost metagenome]
MDHQVVAGPHFDGEGRARNLHVLVHGRNAAVHGAAAAGDIGQDRGLKGGSLLHDVGGHTFDVADDFWKLGHGASSG